MSLPVDPFYEELGRRVRIFREKREITQTQLGQSLDPKVTRASIANLEAGTQRVLAHTLSQLAAALEVRIDELIPRTQPVAPESDIPLLLARRLKLSPAKLQRLTKRLKLKI